MLLLYALLCFNKTQIQNHRLVSDCRLKNYRVHPQFLNDVVTTVSGKFQVGGSWHKDTRFYNGFSRDQRTVQESGRGFVRIGLTFVEWDPTLNTDTSRPPVTMIISSIDLRDTGFKLKEVIPPTLEGAGRGGLCTWAEGLRSLRVSDFFPPVDDDTDFRSWCERIIPFFVFKRGTSLVLGPPMHIYDTKKARGKEGIRCRCYERQRSEAEEIGLTHTR